MRKQLSALFPLRFILLLAFIASACNGKTIATTPTSLFPSEEEVGNVNKTEAGCWITDVTFTDYNHFKTSGYSTYKNSVTIHRLRTSETAIWTIVNNPWADVVFYTDHSLGLTLYMQVLKISDGSLLCGMDVHIL